MNAPVAAPQSDAERDPRTTIGAAENVVRILGRKQVRRMMTRSDLPGLTFLVGHCALLGLTGSILWQVASTFWAAPAVLLHGFVIVNLFAPLHECSHRTAFRSRWLNELVYWACGLVLGLMPTAFRFQHAEHHTYTQDERRDPQMIPMGEWLSGYLFYASALPYFRGILRNLVCHASRRFNNAERRYIPPNLRTQVQREALLFWAVYAGLAAGSIALQSWTVLLLWLIPRIVAEPLERIIRMSEHVGCARSRDMLENSRTVYTVLPIRLLAWNMPYHTAHHAVPLVPFHALPRLNAALGDHLHEVRRGYLRTVRFHLANAGRR